AARARGTAMIRALVKTLRPHQWVKNLFVLAPLVFAEQALEPAHILRAALAFLIFSVLSGCVYILNDLVDVENDRQHPVKRFRPIASGALPVLTARMALAGLLLGVIAVSFAALPTTFAAVGLTYFTLNVAYSFALKHVPFVDVACIASGFLLRLVGGAVAVQVPITIWIFTCTFFLAMTLALGKRKHEILQAGARGRDQRRVLARYDLGHVSIAMVAMALATVVSYALYTAFGDRHGRLFDPRDLAWTIPCVLFGLWRFNRLVNKADEGRSPTDLMLRDMPFLVNLGVWSVIVVAVIYVH
ncbi:MAG: decaprenyl-phosphate phosphoribosyltransferase, partial [Myxococcota bacterium]